MPEVETLRRSFSLANATVALTSSTNTATHSHAREQPYSHTQLALLCGRGHPHSQWHSQLQWRSQQWLAQPAVAQPAVAGKAAEVGAAWQEGMDGLVAGL